MTKRICPKCNNEIQPVEPYCTNNECLMRNVKTWNVSPSEGYLTFVEGNKYPLRALPIQEVVNTIAFLKRNIMATIRPVGKFPLIILALLFTSKKKILNNCLLWMHNLYQSDYNGLIRNNVRPDTLCPASRELDQALRAANPLPGQAQWIDLLVAVFESDLAYRFRIQNILEELDLYQLNENPRKEIMRLLDLNIEREVVVYNADQKNKAIFLRKLIWWALWVPSIRKFIINILRSINPAKVAMDVNDRYWVSERFDYNYNGLTYVERQLWRHKEHEGWVESEQKIPGVVADKPRVMINQPNQAFYDLDEKGLEIIAEQTKQALIKNYYEKHKKELPTATQ